MVDLTPEQEEEAQGMYRSALEKGKNPSAYGRSSEVLQRYAELMKPTWSSYKATTYVPSERERLISERIAIANAKPGEIISTPTLTGQREALASSRGLSYAGGRELTPAETSYTKTLSPYQRLYYKRGTSGYGQSRFQATPTEVVESKYTISPSGYVTTTEQQVFQQGIGLSYAGGRELTKEETEYTKTLTPEQKKVYISGLNKDYNTPITGRMAGESISDYNTRVNKAYEESLKKSGVKIRYGIGDDMPGFSFSDIETGGWSKFGRQNEPNEIYVNWIGSLFYGGPKQVIKHEYGHMVTMGLPGTEEEWKTATGGVMSGTDKYYQSGTGSVGAFGESMIGLKGEYQARSFALFMDDPEKFKAKNPIIASSFEGVLGIGMSRITKKVEDTKNVFGLTGGIIGTRTTVREQNSFGGGKSRGGGVGVGPTGTSVIVKPEPIGQRVISKVLKPFEWFGEIRVPEKVRVPTQIGLITGKQTYLPSVGEVATGTIKVLRGSGEWLANKATNLAKLSGKSLEKTVPAYKGVIPLYQTGTIVGQPGKGYNLPTQIINVEEKKVPTARGYLIKGISVAPETAAWIAAPEVMAVTQATASAKTIKDIDKLANGEQIKSSLKEQAVFTGGMAVATLGLSAGTRAYKYLKTPVIEYRSYDILTNKEYITSKKPMKPISKNWFNEQSVISPDVRITTDLQVIQFVPSVDIKITTKGRELFRMKPKFDWTPLNNQQINIFEPAFKSAIVGNQPYIATTQRVSSVPYGKLSKEEVELLASSLSKRTPSAKFFEVTGVAEPIEYKTISTLQKPEQYTWMGGKGGIIVQDELTQLSEGTVQSKQYFGKLGETTETFYTASYIKPIVDIGEGQVKISNVKTLFKDITFPNYRASGKIQKLPGTLVEIQVPETPPMFKFDLTDVKFKAPELSANLPSSIQKQNTFNLLAKSIKPVPSKVFPKVSPPPKVVVTQPSVELQGFGLPSMVGGTGLVSSTYWGTGTYEKTTGGTTPSSFGFSLTGNVVKQPTIVKPFENVINVQQPRVETITKERFIQKEFITPKEILQPREVLSPKEVIVPKEALTQKEKLIQKENLIQRQKLDSKPTSIRFPKTPIQKIPKPSDYFSSKAKKSVGILEEKFVPEVRRRGKWFELGKTQSLLGARMKAERFVSGTLGASFRIRRGKELVNLPNLGRTIIPSKRERRTYIQVKRTRLGQKSEVSEIQSALKGKKTGRRFRWF